MKDKLIIISSYLFMAGMSLSVGIVVYKEFQSLERTPPTPMAMGVMAGVAFFTLLALIFWDEGNDDERS